MNSAPPSLQHAQQLHRMGNLDAAQQLYNQLLQSQPQNTGALQGLGLIAQARGDYASAVDYFQKSLNISPNDAICLNNLGGVYRSQRQFDQAREAFDRALDLQPQLTRAIVNLSLTFRDMDKLGQAEAALRRAVQLEPNNVDFLNRLANTQKEQGRSQEAMESYRKAVAIDSVNIESLRGLCKAYRDLEMHDPALQCARRLIQIDPKNPDHYILMGATLKAAGQEDGGAEMWERALQMNSKSLSLMLSLAHYYETHHRRDEAVKMIQLAMEAHPESALPNFHLAAFTGKTEPTAPAEYVAGLFDEYADSFEQHLTQYLHYHVPELMFKTVRDACPDRLFDILDLGCGTGLCAHFFKPVSKSIVGVDISAKMIEKSRQRNLYTKLFHGDVTQALREHPNSFDLVLSADVFIYVGDLAEAFSATAAALRTGGLFAFSIEGHEGEGFVLRSTRRYGHSLHYIRQLALKNGFEELKTDAVTIRKEEEGAINGYVILLKKRR